MGSPDDQRFHLLASISCQPCKWSYAHYIYINHVAGYASYFEQKKILQISQMQVYLQPTNEVLEQKFADPKIDQFSVRNVVPRLAFRSLSVVIATTLAAMFPFFGDINAVIGAFGCIPLDFILPMIFYNVTFKPSKQSLIFWGNTLLAVIFSILGALGAISSIRQIILDANTYSFFANI